MTTDNKKSGNIITLMKKEYDVLSLTDSTSLLYYAIKKGKLEIVKMLAKDDVNINDPGSHGWTPLHVATIYGYDKIVKFLINKGASVDSELVGPEGLKFTPLHLAAGENHVNCARILLEHDASISPKINNIYQPIHLAVLYGYVEMAALLLDYGADVNLRFNNRILEQCNHGLHKALWINNNFPLLHYSILRNFNEMTKLLLDRGADVNIKTHGAKTTLMQAMRANNIDLVHYLVEKKNANVNDCDKYGTRVIFFILNNFIPTQTMYQRHLYNSVHDRLEILKFLVKHGANVNVQLPPNTPCSTLVHFLSTHGVWEIIEYLLYETDYDFSQIDFNTLTNAVILRAPSIVGNDDHVIYLRERFQKTVNIFVRRAIERKVIGLPVNKGVLITEPIHNWVSTEQFKEEINSFRVQTEDTINFMKRTKIGDSNITFWRLLTCKTGELVKLMSYKSEEFFDALEQSKFKIYCYYHILKTRLLSAKKRKVLLERSAEVLFNSLKNLLPYDCCPAIVDYCSDRELGPIAGSNKVKK